jgi:hypothetical protein
MDKTPQTNDYQQVLAGQPLLSLSPIIKCHSQGLFLSYFYRVHFHAKCSYSNWETLMRRNHYQNMGSWTLQAWATVMQYWKFWVSPLDQYYLNDLTSEL